MIFVDTGAWFAICVPSDQYHSAAVEFLASCREPLLTTDYVYDEVLTLFRRRGHANRVRLWIDQVRAEQIALEWVQPADVLQATDLYLRFDDKRWSFTDCVSRVVMERLQIRTAFSFDRDFEQFGTVTVVP